MPIDAKGSKFERSISNINSNNRLSQSTSYQSFHNKTSHQVASSVVSSKSNNSLGQGLSEGLIENEELIEKLFPKCRPRSKTFERKPANPKDPSESQSGVNEREMSNATSSGESTKLVEHSSNEWTGRSVLSRRTLHHRRTWNFMDISPSPSPPPLSPIDDHSPCDFKQSQQANSSANLARSDSDTTSDKILSSSHLRSNQTMHYLSNELANNCAFRNRRPNLGSSVETNKCEAIQDKWNEKSQTSYYQGNEPGSKAANREVGANFRLDTLLLSPEKKHDSNRISNGIRKTNRIALDLDQTDDDDILFSRIGEIKTIERVNCSNQNCLKSPNEKTGHVYSSENKSSCDDLQRFTTDSYRDESVGKRTVSSEERSSKSVIRKSDSTEDEDNETTMVIRNRIEIAGGKELFSSSRTSRGRSKKRSHQPDGQSCLVKSWSESSRTSSSSARQTQLFSVSSMHTADNSRVPEIVPSSGEECQAVDHCRSQQTTDQVVSREHCHFKPLVLDRGCPSPPDANQCCQQTAPESTHVSQRSLYVSSQLLDENDRTQLNKGCRDVLDVSDDIQSNFSSQHENKCRMSLHGESSAIQFYSNSIEDQSVNDDTHETNRSLTPELPSHDTEQPVLEDNSSQQHLCDKFDTDNDVSLTCDQFARDLKTKLNVVSEFQQTTKHEIKCDAECCVNEDENDSNDDQNEGSNRVDLHGDTSSVGSCLSKKSFDVNHERIARVIGSVPIAQYEGSPKRYGPKPGYPKRVLASNDSLAKQTSTDYDTVLEKIEPEMRTVKGSTLSSDNGSPHSSSASSSSSATFSSSDIHSSSSFSCPTNQNQSSRFYNWNLPSPKNSIEGNLSVSLNRRLVYNDHKITPGVGPKHISRDEVVKSILSIPNGPVDTEEDGDDVTLSKKMPLHKDGDSVTTSISLSSQPKSEPLYSTLIFPNKCDATKSNGYEQNHLTKPSLLEDKVSNGCDLVMQKSTSSVKPNQMATNDVLSRDSVPLNHRYKLTSGDGSSAMRSVPKSLQLSQYPEYRFQASQSFESTDSSYRSDKFSSRDYYYGQSDEDSYLYEQKTNFPLKDACSFLNGSTSEDKHLNANVGKLSYVTCLSPELSIAKDHSTYLNTLNSDAHSMCPEKGLYSDKFATELTGPTLNTMPILEDGLSSGMPSSDEMDYDEEDDCEEDLAPTEQDLDEYVNEYNNNRTVLGCESVTTSQCASGLNSDLVNGVESATYSTYRYKTSALDEFEKSGKSAADGAAAQQFVFQCPNKTQYTLETVDELGKKKKESSYHHATYYSDHHLHHLNHVHNHPVLDDSRQSITSPYEGNKHLGSSGQEISSLSNHTHDKFCESSQARSNSGNNASLSSLRTAGQIGAGACKPGSSPVHGGPQSGPSLHHHYHHYYHHHHSSLGGGRQNYPNLSSSPTSVSPNSPGALPGHIQSSASSSSSSHQGYSTSQLHYLQQAASQSQVTDMPGANSPSSLAVSGVAPNVRHHHDEDCDTDQETDRLLGSQRNDERGYYEDKLREKQVNYIDNNNNPLAPLKRSSTSREGSWDPKVLIEGVLFRARYLGSTQLVCDGQPTKATRMMQAEEAVSRIKAPEGETQPSTEVDLFISTEKIMVLNTDLKEIMMDHALRTISYIADIGDLLVLMARRRSPLDEQNDGSIKRNPKMICHVFESDEAQYIAQSIGQAFQVAYMEFLKANGIKDSAFLKEMDYQEVLNSQEIFGDELEMFSKRDKQKEVIVPKQKGEILGIVIVESGWGSMLPTVVIANLAQSSPSARCGQLNIGDQIIAINGISLVGLPLSTCQNYVKNTKNQTAVKFTIVPCPPVVEVKIKRPDTKYQLGFSVQNGVICSLLRGGIAERGGVRVGHRIIEINGQSVVAVPHDRIVNLLATSVGEIHMKTMPTSMFRLLTGQESPSFM